MREEYGMGWGFEGFESDEKGRGVRQEKYEDVCMYVYFMKTRLGVCMYV